jgi:hypothetical protein
MCSKKLKSPKYRITFRWPISKSEYNSREYSSRKIKEEIEDRKERDNVLKMREQNRQSRPREIDGFSLSYRNFYFFLSNFQPYVNEFKGQNSLAQNKSYDRKKTIETRL